MAIESPGTLPRETTSGEPPTPWFQQETVASFCSLMHISSHFCQSPANVTGDSALVQCDSPPVTLGNAGSYDSFRVTLGPGWLIMQAFRRAVSWTPTPGTAQEAIATLSCLTAL